jgi:hypothetical protein
MQNGHAAVQHRHPWSVDMDMHAAWIWTWTQTVGSESKWIEANISSFRFALCSKRIFWSKLKRIETNILFFRFAFVLKRIFWSDLKRIEANIFIWIFTNQSEYSPNKTSIRFDSLHSGYLKEANMGHPTRNQVSLENPWICWVHYVCK